MDKQKKTEEKEMPCSMARQKVSIAGYSINDEGNGHFGEMTVKFIFTDRHRALEDYEKFFQEITRCCSALS